MNFSKAVFPKQWNALRNVRDAYNTWDGEGYV